MELDEVAGGIADERLPARAYRLGVAHLDTPVPKLIHGGVEIGDQQGEVLT